MFSLRRLLGKKKQTPQENVPAEERKQPSSPQRRVAFSDTPAASTSAASAKPAEASTKPVEASAKPVEASAKPVEASAKPVEASAKPAETGQDTKTKKRKWLNRLFGRTLQKRVSEEKPPAPEKSTTDAQTARSTKKTTKKWWRGLFKCCRTCRVAPCPNSDEEERNSPRPKQRVSFAKVTNEMDEMDKMEEMDNTEEEITFTDAINMLLDESIEITDNSMLSDLMLDNEVVEQLLLQQLLITMFSNSNTTNQPREDVQSRTVDRFGFPNIGQSCYMNSSLQSILALEDFMGDISRMEQVWSSVPQGELMRSLMKIRDVHTSTDPKIKTSLLRSLKKTISIQAPEFRDNQQKDAHEFLTIVFSQMRSLGPLLKEAAALRGISYICPVEDHLVFRMENTRTCKSCGSQSARQEDFCNLSLDLICGSSVEQMLEGYLKETDLDFKCECGGTTSGQKLSFATLPRVLMLHLKRFRFTPSFNLEKVQDPVQLLSHLKVSCKQDVGRYSLVSIISHFGISGAGHYICDGICPDSPDDESNRWLTFNDSSVYKTTCASVCEQRQESAYILFYKQEA